MGNWRDERRADGALTSTDTGTAVAAEPAIMMESLPYQVARVVEPEDAEFMSKQVSCEVLTRTDGVMLVLFSTPWRLEGFQRDNPSIKLRSLVAAAES